MKRPPRRQVDFKTDSLSIKQDPNLDSPIKAIISNECFDINAAIQLENDFVLTIAIGEFEMGHDFHRLSELERKRIAFILEIASS